MKLLVVFSLVVMRLLRMNLARTNRVHSDSNQKQNQKNESGPHRRCPSSLHVCFFERRSDVSKKVGLARRDSLSAGAIIFISDSIGGIKLFP